MYNFIFYFFYKYFEKTKDFSPRFSAICATAGAQFIHVFFLLSLLKYLFQFDIPRFNESYGINKLYLSPFFIIWLIVVYFYYKRDRVNSILEERDKLSEKVFTFKRIATIILVIGVPLILGIIFIKMGQKV